MSRPLFAKRRETCKFTNSHRFLWKKRFSKKIACYIMYKEGKIPLISLANPCCPSKISYPSLLLPSSSKLLPQPPTQIIRVEPREKPHVIFNPSPTTATRICKNGMAHTTTMGLFKTFFLWLFFAKCVLMDLLARLQESPPFCLSSGDINARTRIWQI